MSSGATHHYPDIWQQFIQSPTTLPTEDRDHAEWHLDRPHYSLWAIQVLDSRVHARVQAAHDRLDEYLFSPYQRQPHITLYVCGFPSLSGRSEQEYLPEQQSRHIQGLQAAALTPFTITVGGFNSFTAAPFLEVHDLENGIQRVRGILLQSRPEDRTTPYTPHLTIGLYRGAFPTSSVARKAMALPDGPPIQYTVNRIHFMVYRTARIAGPLTPRYTIIF